VTMCVFLPLPVSNVALGVSPQMHKLYKVCATSAACIYDPDHPAPGFRFEAMHKASSDDLSPVSQVLQT